MLSGDRLQGLVRGRHDPVGNHQLADAQPLHIQLVKGERMNPRLTDSELPDQEN